MPPKAAERSKTLDVREPQILLHVPDDADGYPWHHRLLVLQIKAGRWVSLDPELELQTVDLDSVDYVLLDRHGDFPPEKYQDVFAFEPLPQSEVGGYRRKARTFLALHGDGDAAADQQIWVVADPRDEFFGTVVSQQVIEESEYVVEGGVKGIVEHEEEYRFVEKIGKSELDATMKKWRAADADCRIFKIQRDAAGNRNRSLADTAPLLSEEAMPDWPHSGERSFKEASDAVLRTSQNWKTYHLTWKQESGVATGSSLCHEHEVLCEAFRFGHEVDQINASNLCSFELLMRRMIQIEMAVSRNSKAPDFTGLSVVLSSVVDGSGAIQTKGFHKWVADKNESRARIMKSERLYYEERAATRKKQKGDQKGKDPKGKGRGGAASADAP